MTAILLPSGRLRYHAYIDGVYGPAAQYKLYTYEAGTTTPKATYTTSSATVSLSNPIVLDDNGECAPYGLGAYKLLLTDPDDAPVEGWPQDNVILSLDSVNAEWCSVGGTVDAIELTPANAITSYSAGKVFQFIASGANTGPVTVAASGLAAKNLTFNGSTALGAGDLVSGKIYVIQYDGTRFQLLTNPYATDLTDDSKRFVTTEYLKDLTATDSRAGLIETATTAESKTGTSTSLATTPGTQKYHPLHLKAIGAVDTTTPASSVLYGAQRISGISRSGTGEYVVTTSDTYATDGDGNVLMFPVVQAHHSGSNIRAAKITAKTATTFTVKFENLASATADPDEGFYIHIAGELA